MFVSRCAIESAASSGHTHIDTHLLSTLIALVTNDYVRLVLTLRAEVWSRRENRTGAGKNQTKKEQKKQTESIYRKGGGSGGGWREGENTTSEQMAPAVCGVSAVRLNDYANVSGASAAVQTITAWNGLPCWALPPVSLTASPFQKRDRNSATGP